MIDRALLRAPLPAILVVLFVAGCSDDESNGQPRDTQRRPLRRHSCSKARARS
jgi:hypothetical protein